MIKKSCFIFTLLIGIVLFSGMGYAYDARLQNYWNFTGLTDLVGAQVLVNTGASANTSYPSYSISGSSTPNSFQFIQSQGDTLSKTDAFATMSANTFTISWWVNPKNSSTMAHFKLTGTEGTDHIRCDSSWTGAYYKVNCIIYDGSYLLDVDSTANLDFNE
jgi:hypothetical protein